MDFKLRLIDQFTDPFVPGAIAKDNWVLGPSGQQSAVQNQYESLFPDILDLYSNEFIGAWNVAISNLALRPLLADRRKYLALSAAAVVVYRFMLDSTSQQAITQRDALLEQLAR